jgi:hypothetical protein
MIPAFNSIRLSFDPPEETEVRISMKNNMTLDDVFVMAGGFGKQYL